MVVRGNEVNMRKIREVKEDECKVGDSEGLCGGNVERHGVLSIEPTFVS